MPYLTHDEYIKLGFSELDETEFNKLIKKAGDAVDSITRYFYKFNDIDDDVPFRRDQFKKAVACQVSYFNDMGATSTHELNEPGSVQIGRTSISQGSRNSSGASEKKNSIIADDVYMYLRYTGLLYRGLAVK